MAACPSGRRRCRWVRWGAASTRANTKAWAKSNVWINGFHLFYESGNNTDYLLFLSRALMALFSVALGGLVFAWSRRLWATRADWLSLALYCFCPNFLALPRCHVRCGDGARPAGSLRRRSGGSRELTWKSGVWSSPVVALTAVRILLCAAASQFFALIGGGFRLRSEETPGRGPWGATRKIPGLARQARDVRRLHSALAFSGRVGGDWAFFGFDIRRWPPGMPRRRISFWAGWS